MSSLSHPKLQAESDQDEADFLKSELALCFTFSILAAMKYEAGNRASVKESIAHAEETYATVFQFLSHPKRSSRLTDEEIRSLIAESERVREGLDRVIRYVGHRTRVFVTSATLT